MHIEIELRLVVVLLLGLGLGLLELLPALLLLRRKLRLLELDVRHHRRLLSSMLLPHRSRLHWGRSHHVARVLLL